MIPFQITLLESRFLLSINELCFVDETIAEVYEGAGWEFPVPTYTMSQNLHIHSQGFEIFCHEIFPPHYTNVFLLKSLAPNIKWKDEWIHESDPWE